MQNEYTRIFASQFVGEEADWPFPTIDFKKKIEEPFEGDIKPMDKEGIIMKLTEQPKLMNPAGGDTPVSTAHQLNILFLNIDGVLNSHKMQVLYHTLPHSLVKKDCWGSWLSGKEAVDKYAVSLINQLCEATDTKIVLSSTWTTWRIGYKLDQLMEIVAELGLRPSLLIGMTSTKGDTRGEQIEEFIQILQGINGASLLVERGLLAPEFKEISKIRVNNYAIVDDDSDMLDYQLKYHFVKTTFMEGLTLGNTIDLGKILSNDETFYLKQLSNRTVQ